MDYKPAGDGIYVLKIEQWQYQYRYTAFERWDGVSKERELTYFDDDPGVRYNRIAGQRALDAIYQAYPDVMERTGPRDDTHAGVVVRDMATEESQYAYLVERATGETSANILHEWAPRDASVIRHLTADEVLRGDISHPNTIDPAELEKLMSISKQYALSRMLHGGIDELPGLTPDLAQSVDKLASELAAEMHATDHLTGEADKASAALIAAPKPPFYPLPVAPPFVILGIIAAMLIVSALIVILPRLAAL